MSSDQLPGFCGIDFSDWWLLRAGWAVSQLSGIWDGVSSFWNCTQQNEHLMGAQTATRGLIFELSGMFLRRK